MESPTVNLMIYIGKDKDFSHAYWGSEAQSMIKVQIDNSLEFGWDPRDILLVTNFEYEYRGVKALVVGSENFCSFCPPASKVYTILDLFNQGKLKGLVWFHDLDATQLMSLSVDMGGYDMALTDYGGSSRWSTGSIFFTPSSLDIFLFIRDFMEKHRCDEEMALWSLTEHSKSLSNRVKRLDVSYNFAVSNRAIRRNYQKAEKPLKVIHFHPFDRKPLEWGKDARRVCLYGENKVGVQFVPERVVEVFKRHGIQ